VARGQGKFSLWGSLGILAIGVGVLGYVIALMVQPKPPATLDKATRQVERRWFPKAIVTLSDLLDAEPRNTDARVLRAHCYLKTRQFDEARADFALALQHKPGLPGARLGLAKVLRSRKKYDEAIAIAREVAKDHPNIPGPYAVIGKVEFTRFQVEARECVQLLEDDPHNPLTIAASTEIRLGRFDKTEAYWKRWYEKDPGNAVLKKLRKHLDAAKAHFARAVENLRKGCGSVPGVVGKGEPETGLLLAAVLLEAGQFDAAEEVVDLALARTGVDRVQGTLIKAQVLSDRAAQLMREAAADDDDGKRERANTNTRKAIDLLEKLVDDYPHAERARDKLIAYYIRALRFDDADRLAAKKRVGPRNPMAHYVKAIVHLARGAYDEATSELLLVQSEMGGQPQYHFSLGLAYYRGGGPQASVALATSQFQLVTKLRPGFVPARFRLAKLYLRQGAYADVREQCERILDLPGRPARLNAPVLIMLSEALQGLKDYSGALRRLDIAYQLTGDTAKNPLIAQWYAVIEQGKEDQVLENIDQALAKLKTPRDKAAFECIRGYAYLKQGKRKDAFASFRSALFRDRTYIMVYVHLANAYDAYNELDKAVKEYERGVKMMSDLRLPKNAALHFGLAQVYVKQNRPIDARRQLAEVLEIDGNHAAARLRLAALELRDRNFEKALREVELVIRRHETAEARFLAGLIHSASARRPAAEIKADIERQRRGTPGMRGVQVTEADIAAARRLSWNRAVKSYEKAIELDPRFRFSYEVGLIYAMQRKFVKMVSVYRRALKAAPPAARRQLHRRLAMALCASARYRDAVAAARQAVQLSSRASRPDPNELLRNRFTLINCLIANAEFGEARAEVTRTTGALAGFRKAYLAMIDRLSRMRADAAAVAGGGGGGRELNEVAGRELNLALLFSRAGVAWLPQAELVYNQLLQNDVDNVIAMRYLGDLYIVTRRLGKAEAINKKILRVSPGFALALRNLAAIEEMRTRAEAAKKATPDERIKAQAQAVAYYQMAMNADPTFWLPKLELAAIYQRAGMKKKALELYEAVIKLNPSQVQALNDYANLCAEEQQNLDQAIQYARKASQLSPHSGEVADTLGLLHTMMGKPEKALEELEKARYLLPNHPTVTYHLAVACVKTGKKARALTILNGLLKSKAPFAERDEAVLLRDKLQSELKTP
jgi:tetratricopeptide (TPR) repeat protein